MKIFIDESGNFQPGIPGHRISAIGALVVPDLRFQSLERQYLKLRPSLPKEKGEVKGRLLSEMEIQQICQLLFTHSVLFEASVTDSSINDPLVVLAHKERQARLLVANLTEKHHPEFRRSVEKLAEQLEQFPLQLYVQSCLMLDVIKTVLAHGTMYFSQRLPRELGHFDWVIDAKDKVRITEWERWWQTTILPFLESSSKDEPMPMIRWGNYSHFRRFDIRPSEFKAKQLGVRRDRPLTNIKAVMTESFVFDNSASPGIELADIATNSLRRALTGNLQRDGWLAIRSLMIHRREQYFNALAFGDVRPPIKKLPYKNVVPDFRRGGRNMTKRPL